MNYSRGASQYGSTKGVAHKLFIFSKRSLLTVLYDPYSEATPVIVDTTLLILTFLPQEIHLRSELSDHLLEIFNARQLFADRSGQLSRHSIGRNTDRLRDILERILNRCGAVRFESRRPMVGASGPERKSPSTAER